MKKDIQQNWFFNQTPEVVWEYLTKPELIEQWLMKNDFKPVVGHKFQFKSTKEGSSCNTTYCEVLEVNPPKRLSYSWKREKEDGQKIDSVVIWTLVEKNGGTELQLLHNGFTVLEDFTAHQNGWNELVNGLLTQLNTKTNEAAIV